MDPADGHFYCVACWLVFHAANVRFWRSSARAQPARHVQGVSCAPGLAPNKRDGTEKRKKLTETARRLKTSRGRRQRESKRDCLRVGVAADGRAPGSDVVNVLVAVDIVSIRTLHMRHRSASAWRHTSQMSMQPPSYAYTHAAYTSSSGTASGDGPALRFDSIPMHPAIFAFEHGTANKTPHAPRRGRRRRVRRPRT